MQKYAALKKRIAPHANSRCCWVIIDSLHIMMPTRNVRCTNVFSQTTYSPYCSYTPYCSYLSIAGWRPSRLHSMMSMFAMFVCMFAMFACLLSMMPCSHMFACLLCLHVPFRCKFAPLCLCSSSSLLLRHCWGPTRDASRPQQVCPKRHPGACCGILENQQPRQCEQGPH